MSHAHANRFAPRKKRRRRLAVRWPGARTRRRLVRALRGAPLAVRLVVAPALVVASWFVLNGLYQVACKPTELFFPVSGTLSKTPAETWRQYEPSFREHSTAIITPTFLAALAQVEGAGNPVARTYWRWRLSWRPFELYRPASSAVGMYQITDGTFREARRYCIHDHAVVEDGPWRDTRSCWFNFLYSRVVPSHAIEMTSALLHRQVALTLERRRIAGATLRQRQALAAVAHLCGAEAGDAYARRGFQFAAGQRCGDHDPRAYVARVEAMTQVFARLASARVSDQPAASAAEGGPPSGRPRAANASSARARSPKMALASSDIVPTGEPVGGDTPFGRRSAAPETETHPRHA